MGKIVYGASCQVELDDRTLAHVKVVILSKLRLGQSFPFSWIHQQREGRSTIWLNPAVPLEFHFETSLRPEPNMQWIEALIDSANSSDGMSVVAEP